MPGSKKTFNVPDIIKYAKPNVFNIDIDLTAARLQIDEGERYFAYSSIWPRLEHMIRHGATEEYLTKTFAFYKDEWKNRYLRDVARELNNYFSNRGKWYKSKSKPIPTLGISFWPAQHGVWFQNNRAYNILINPSKSVQISNEEARFIARATYELHGRDDPNNPDQIVLDLSKSNTKGERTLTAYHFTESNLMSLREFEDILMRFFQSLSQAGMAKRPSSGSEVREFLRRKSL